MDYIEKINDKVIDLWKQHYNNDGNVLSPLLYGELKTNVLLFIGLNPSFSERGIINLLRNTQWANCSISYLHRFCNINKYRDVIIQIHKLALDSYPYFSKCREISEELKIDWEHIDIFFERETSQKVIEAEYFSNGILSDFARQQFDLSFSLLTFINPIVIIVINALASKIIIQSKGENIKFDYDYGCHVLNENNNKYPIFFSGMISGRRALDLYSLERLKWHIKFVLKNKKY